MMLYNIFTNGTVEAIISSNYCKAMKSVAFCCFNYGCTSGKKISLAIIRSKLGAKKIARSIVGVFLENKSITSTFHAMKTACNIATNLTRLKVNSNDCLELLRYFIAFKISRLIKIGIKNQYNQYSDAELNFVLDFAASIIIVGVSKGLAHIPANMIDSLLRSSLGLKANKSITESQKKIYPVIYRKDTDKLILLVKKLANFMAVKPKYITLVKSANKYKFEIDESKFWNIHESEFQKILKAETKQAKTKRKLKKKVFKSTYREDILREKFKIKKLAAFDTGILRKVNIIGKRVTNIEEIFKKNKIKTRKPVTLTKLYKNISDNTKDQFTSECTKSCQDSERLVYFKVK